MKQRQTNDAWEKRYGFVCSSEGGGTLINISGIGRRDTYNVAFHKYSDQKIIAFRAERRISFAWRRQYYHPMIHFATQHRNGWRITPDIQPFDMMEDPFFVEVTTASSKQLIFGGVRVRREGHKVIPCTEFYKGDDIYSLDRKPFLVVDNMKDIRLMQLPERDFLLCNRPWGKQHGRGRITLHIINDLEQVADTNIKTIAILDAGDNPHAWAGINDVYILEDEKKEQWVGLLGHVAFDDEGRHYAACTYKIRLKDLRDHKVRDIEPQVIATRACFPPAPAKRKTLRDVVFPGHLEHLHNHTYRLWAGLSDARIGTIDIDDPFKLRAKADD